MSDKEERRFVASPYRQIVENLSCPEIMNICRKVIEDGNICEEEAHFLMDWFGVYPEAALCWPGNVLATRLIKVWEDGQVTSEELDELKKLIADLSESCGQTFNAQQSASVPAPFDQPEPEIKFTGKSFCFTGKAAAAPHKDCEEMVRELGGRVETEPGPALDYLVIGVLNSPDWRKSDFAGIISKAFETRENGYPVKIIREDRWFRAVMARRIA